MKTKRVLVKSVCILLVEKRLNSLFCINNLSKVIFANINDITVNFMENYSNRLNFALDQYNGLMRYQGISFQIRLKIWKAVFDLFISFTCYR